MRGRIGGMIIVAVFLFVVLGFCSIAQAEKPSTTPSTPFRSTTEFL